MSDFSYDQNQNVHAKNRTPRKRRKRRTIFFGCRFSNVNVRSTISVTLVGSSPYHSLNGFTDIKVPNPQGKNKHEKGIPLREFYSSRSSLLSVLVPNLPIRPWGRIEEWAFQKISVHGV